jgi:hypothetical protein
MADDVRGPQLRCRACLHLLDAHRGETPDAVPEDGDASLCWRCGTVSIYEIGPLGTRLVAPTAEQQAEIDTDPTIAAAREALVQAKAVGAGAEVAVARWRRR